MITCTLKDRKYAIDFVSGRALREHEGVGGGGDIGEAELVGHPP